MMRNWGISTQSCAAPALTCRLGMRGGLQPGFIGATVLNSLLRGAAFILQVLNLIGPFDHEAGPYVVGAGLLMLTAAAPLGPCCIAESSEPNKSLQPTPLRGAAGFILRRHRRAQRI